MRLQTYLLSVLTLLLAGNHCFASHATGADITYTCLGNNQYKITVAFYRYCSGIGAPNFITIDYFSPSCGIAQGTHDTILDLQSSQEITPICPNVNSTCNGGTFPGVEQYIYSGIITLPQSCQDWIIGFAECCRSNIISNLQSGSSYDLYAYASINNTGGLCNNSPEFTSLPIYLLCNGQLVNYNQSAVDSEGDSLVLSLINPMDDYNTPIPYQAGFNLNYPLSTTTGTFDFNPFTGQMTFTPSNPQVAVIAVMVKEYRSGMLIGTVMRDVQVIVVSNCSNTSASVPVVDSISGGAFLGVDSFSTQTCVSNPLYMKLSITDPDSNITALTSDVLSRLPGSSYSDTSSPFYATSSLSWTPTLSDTGSHFFTITVSEKSCPIIASNTYVFNINVFNRVIIENPDTVVFCGPPQQLSAIGGTYFNWTPTTGLSNPNIHNPLAAPAASTMYYVTSDCGMDSVFVDVKPSFSIDAGNDTSLCLNSLLPINASVDPAYTPYTFNWSPPVSLSDPAVLNPIANPTNTTTYELSATANFGCTKKDTVTIIVSGIAPHITASATPDTACIGQMIQLSASISPTICGTGASSCHTPPIDYIIGADSISTEDGTPYGGFWEDGRVQYLFHASELYASGFFGGIIKQIAFNISDKKSVGLYNNLTIKMGCTSSNSLTSFVPGLSTVENSSHYTTVAGWNYHDLDTSYNWDGRSNLIVELCFDNSSFSYDDAVYYSPTSFNSVLYDGADNVNGCSLNDPSVNRHRPNIKFSVCQDSIQGRAVNWWPGAGISNAHIPNPTATMNRTTTFIVEVEDNVCPGQNYVTVYMDSSILMVSAETDTNLCTPAPIQLSAIATGTSPGSFTYSWSPSADLNDSTIANPVALVQQPTSYTVAVTDGICTATDVVNIDFNIDADFSLQTTDCTEDSSFQIVALINSGNTPYNFLWSNGQSVSGQLSDTLQNLSPGAYAITITDNDNCIITPNFSIPIALPLESSITASAPICAGESTGYIISKPLGGVPPYNFMWNTGFNTLSQIADTLPDLASGLYAVTVTDSVNCLIEDSIMLASRVPLVNMFQSTNPLCAGENTGSVIVVPSGGVLPYDFTWNTGANTLNQSKDTLSNLTSGSYLITVTDSVNCSIFDSVILNAVSPALSNIFQYTNPLCAEDNTGEIISLPSGGLPSYEFLWSNGRDVSEELTDTLSDLYAGNYKLTIIDSIGCVLNDSIALTEPDSLQLNLSVTHASCFGCSNGSITAQPSGGTPPYFFSWSTGSEVSFSTGLPAGTYSVSLTDNNGCTKVGVVSVEDGPMSIGQNSLSNAFLLYPNPTDGKFYLEFLRETTVNMEVRVFNALGKTILTDIIPAKSRLRSYDFQSFPKGVYFVEIRQKGNCVSQKVILY